jgi:hypothetical protein
MKLWALILAAFGVIAYWLKAIFMQKKIDVEDTRVVELTNVINQKNQELVKQTEETNKNVDDYETLKKIYDSNKSARGNNGSGSTH